MAFFLLLMFTVVSINVNGLRDRAKQLGFVHWLQSLPSVIDFFFVSKKTIVFLMQNA